MQKVKYHPLFLISGLTCAGKRLLVQKIQQLFPNIQYIITTTDRPKLHNERNGVDHYFVSSQKFEKMRSTGAFIESSSIHGYSYGVSAADIKRLRQNGPSCIILSPKGTIEIAHAFATTTKVYGIFVLADDEGIRRRITERSATQSDLNMYLKESEEELPLITSPCFDLIVNMDDKHIQASIGQVSQFIGQKLMF